MDEQTFLSFHNNGIGKLLGITFESAAPDRVVAQLEVNTSVCTRPDVVHGGAIMALADCASGYGSVLNLPPGHTAVAIEANASFLRKGEGPVVRAESTPLHIGRSMSVWRAGIFRGAEQIAEVTQTQLFLRQNETEEAADAQSQAARPGGAHRARAIRTALSQSFSQPVVDERWRQIFEGACAVITKKGFAKASMREIAAAAGMPIATMYQYLERKEDLLSQIYEYFMSDIVAALHQWRTASVAPRKRVEGVIRTMVEVFDKHQKYIKLMFQETRSLTPQAQRRVYELDQSYIAVIRELLDGAIAESGWKARDSELAANFIYFLCCIWPLRHWTIGKFGQRAVADGIVDFVLNGLAAPHAIEGRK